MERQETNDLFGDTVQLQSGISNGVLKKQLASQLRSLTIEGFAGVLTNAVEESINYAELCKTEKTCQKLSLLFNPHRLETPGAGRPSIFGALQTDGFYTSLITSLHEMRSRGTPSHDCLYKAIERGVGWTDYINEFPPHVMRDILREYHCSSNSRVLDPCGGWGGRMIGTSVVADYYLCYEPASQTAAGLARLLEFLKGFNESFDATIICSPFEDSELADGWFDIAVTSPPYYDTELYSKEGSNACNKFSSFHAWRDGFYFPLIRKTLQALKPGAPFILNVGNRKYPLADCLLDYAEENMYSVTKAAGRLASPGGLRIYGKGEQFYEIRQKG